ncbi:formyltransferase family protein [Pseudodesulfovibrio sp. zrk46]|uniref:formyltransferase family protein n=1 Tax=Pseudodesulfovibrio sp. zrk46 TaxID=2725288 RepID=UPI001449660C|nr:formyltransferase family protein [Pseudodesulfovibrio sp. zrk46]QJB56574.1 hypothetical protein HFN16_09195 [Pseudodesulfovibrio sp. zrk46]
MTEDWKVALLAKEGKPGVPEVSELLEQLFGDVDFFLGKLGDEYPEALLNDSYDMVVSWLSPWIVPAKTLSNTKQFNLNFHPAPPEYPGIGCFNFALYDEVEEYGVTGHVMEPRVDTGVIVGVSRFPVTEGDTVLSLSIKSYDAMLALFNQVLRQIAETGALPETDEKWTRAPFKRTELEALCVLDMEMSESEIHRRVRATTYPGMPGAYFEIGGMKFEYNPDR